MLPDPFVGCVEVAALHGEDEVDALLVVEVHVVFAVAGVALPAELDRGDTVLKKETSCYDLLT